VLNPGRARGRSMADASPCWCVARRFEIRTEGTILFMKMLRKNFRMTHVDAVKLAGKLEGVRGFVFGEMQDCTSARADYTCNSHLRIWGNTTCRVFGLKSGMSPAAT